MSDWISVSDRLPEIDSPVIAACKTDAKDVDVEWWYGCCIYRDYGFPWVKFGNPNPVEYWMPLPEPPELDQ